jgi:cysteine-rich repeat protein
MPPRVIVWRAPGLAMLLVGCGDDIVVPEDQGDEIATETDATESESDESESDSTESDSTGSDSTESESTEESTESDSSESTESESTESESTESDSTESESDSTESGEPEPFCGDAVLGFDEECDDGNQVDFDGCNLDCKLTKALIWEQRIGEPGVCDYFHGVDVGASGLIVAVGSRDKLPAPEHDCEAMIHAFDTDGTPLWALELDGPAGACDQAWGVDVDDASQVYVTGHFYDPATRHDQFVVAISPLGELLWQQIFNRAFDDVGYGLAVDALGQIAVVGAKQNPDLDYDLSLRVLDDQGSELWTDLFPGEGNALAFDVVAGQTIVVTGYTTTIGQAQDAWLRKYTLDGTPVWTRTHDAPQHGNDRGGGVAIDGEGRITVAGFVTGPKNHDIWIQRWDEAGDELWSQIWDDPKLIWADRGQDVAIDPQGHVVVAGQSWSTGTNQNSFDAWLGKYGPDGEPIWLDQTSFPVDGEDVWFAVDVDTSDAAIVVAGATTTEVGACTDAVVRRYNP